MKRTNALKQIVKEQQKPDTLIIFDQTNITYFTNFSGAAALLIPEQGDNTMYVPAVNYEQAKAEVKDFTVECIKRGENLMDKIARQAPTKRFSVDTVPVESWCALAKAVGGEEKLELINSLIRELRKTKDPQEIHLIKEACKIANIGIQTAAETIHPGVKEMQVAAEVEYAMRKAGSDETAFKTIIASGFCCAYPHGTFQNRTIEEGDFVVVDLGATYKFYCSDITRTFAVGKPTNKQRRIYQAVQLAHQKAFETIKPDISASEVDLAARRVIEDAGFGESFVHNLGHGVGLEVHEDPTLSLDSKDVLKEGNVVTIEPGIYLPGFGGVRIEDTVLVTRNSSEKLTLATYML